MAEDLDFNDSRSDRRTRGAVTAPGGTRAKTNSAHNSSLLSASMTRPVGGSHAHSASSPDLRASQESARRDLERTGSARESPDDGMGIAFEYMYGDGQAEEGMGLGIDPCAGVEDSLQGAGRGGIEGEGEPCTDAEDSFVIGRLERDLDRLDRDLRGLDNALGLDEGGVWDQEGTRAGSLGAGVDSHSLSRSRSQVSLDFSSVIPVEGITTGAGSSLTVSDTGGSVSPTVPKKLAERLSMNSLERRKLAATKRLKVLPRATQAGAGAGATNSPSRSGARGERSHAASASPNRGTNGSNGSNGSSSLPQKSPRRSVSGQVGSLGSGQAEVGSLGLPQPTVGGLSPRLGGPAVSAVAFGSSCSTNNSGQAGKINVRDSGCYSTPGSVDQSVAIGAIGATSSSSSSSSSHRRASGTVSTDAELFAALKGKGKGRLADGASSSSNNDSSSSSSSSSSNSSSKKPEDNRPDAFDWEARVKLDGQPLLFIFHDNPQLGSTIAAQIGTTGLRYMEVMLESKDEAGVTYFVLGEIVYSGLIGGVRGCASEVLTQY